MKRLGAMLILFAIAAWFAMPADAQSSCRFVLGFADLRAAVGASTVGDCLEDEQHNIENGDATQRTTKGLAVWRKASNTMAFTDGGTSWVMGPKGVQKRPNNYRFLWEPDGPMVNGGMNNDPDVPFEMTPDLVRVTNANRKAAGLPPLDIGVQPAPPPPGSGDAATATAIARTPEALPTAAATATPTQSPRFASTATATSSTSTGSGIVCKDGYVWPGTTRQGACNDHGGIR